jgi:hypothetical protein
MMTLKYKAERVSRFGTMESMTVLALPVANELHANSHLDFQVSLGFTILEMELI